MADAPNEHPRPHPQPMGLPCLEFDIAREPHDVEALEESACLLTSARPGNKDGPVR